MEEQVSSDLMEELRTLTVEELSQATGIQAWRIRELVKAGKGPPHFRVGMTYRFPVLGVRRWLGEQTDDTKSVRTPGQTK
jgi:predicted DNA-binding transcriptional regulator AlpA